MNVLHRNSGDLMSDEMIAYTDGSYDPKHNTGGWSVVFIDDQGVIVDELYGCGDYPNNYVAELIAIIMALKYSSHHLKITIYTDALPIVQTFKCKKADRKRIFSKMKPVNRRLWIHVTQLSYRRNVALRWVRGHNGNHGNVRADILAKHAARKRLNSH
jgi:ribonuclease HI